MIDYIFKKSLSQVTVNCFVDNHVNIVCVVGLSYKTIVFGSPADLLLKHF